jgi:hypothetical protein
MNQQKYLGLLLSKAHERGMPYLPIEQLSKAQVSAWIDYLKMVVGEEGAKSSPFLPVRQGTDGYRPAVSERISGHLHEVEPWQTEDGWEILECTTCGSQW